MTNISAQGDFKEAIVDNEMKQYNKYFRHVSNKMIHNFIFLINYNKLSYNRGVFRVLKHPQSAVFIQR